MSLTVEKVTNVSRDIKENTTRMLWAVSAGRCEFNGCTNVLYFHQVTKENVNLADRAHIYAFSEGGKRFSKHVPREKINDIENLMLVCGACHKLIDSPNTRYTAEQLLAMKREHEKRMRVLTSIKPDRLSEVVIYTCPIGDRDVHIRDLDVMESITPEYYPARKHPISLRQKSNVFDFDDNFWATMSLDLERQLKWLDFSDKHISLFAVAPQPLLFKLGTLLSRNYIVDVRQSQGDLAVWKWPTKEQTIEILPANELLLDEKCDEAAITLEITARLPDADIEETFADRPVYRIIARNCGPQAIRSEADLKAVIQEYRKALNEIRLKCAPDVRIGLLFVAPASVSVEAGRQLMKGDPHITIYDRNFLTKNWMPTLSFPDREEDFE